MFKQIAVLQVASMLHGCLPTGDYLKKTKNTITPIMIASPTSDAIETSGFTVAGLFFETVFLLILTAPRF